jgi:hypothetical protein
MKHLLEVSDDGLLGMWALVQIGSAVIVNGPESLPEKLRYTTCDIMNEIAEAQGKPVEDPDNGLAIAAREAYVIVEKAVSEALAGQR